VKEEGKRKEKEDKDKYANRDSQKEIHGKGMKKMKKY